MTDDEEFRRVLKLDWSEYHPLDHWPFDARCRQFPGGGRRHLGDTWHYRRREQMIKTFIDPFWKLINCRRGKHRWQISCFQDGDHLVWSAYCWPCDTTRSATHEEITKFGPVPLFGDWTEHVGREDLPE